jgi:hypothetical protein
MAKRKKRRGGGRRGIRIAATIGLVAGLIEAYNHYKAGGTGRVMIGLTGYDPNYGWKPQWAKITLPIIAGCGVSLVAAKVGLNRYTPKGINI